MPRQSGDGWFLRYKTPKASTRLLLSLPKDMLSDAHAAAHAQDISVAELVRRAMTRHMSELIAEHPSLFALRGTRSRGSPVKQVVQGKHGPTEPSGG